MNNSFDENGLELKGKVESAKTKKKNQALLGYVYTTFGIVSFFMILVLICSLPLFMETGEITRESIGNAMIVSVLWFLTSWIPFVNFIILIVNWVRTKVSYKIEIAIAIVLAILQLPVLIISVSGAAYF